MKTFLLFLGATVAHAASWSKGGIPSGGIVSVSITAVKGVADTAILAGAPSSGGDGPHTYISSDYGQTFTESAGKVGMDLMLLSVGASSGNANNVCVGGIVGVHHTQDGGKTWGLSAGGPGTSQSLIGFGAGSFGAAYQQGAAVSTDGGKTFTKHAIPGLNTTLYPARYAAFPSATTWYVSHGTWETTGATATPGVSVHLSDTISFAQGRGLKHTPVSDYSVAGNASDGYAGAISKTTDGGESWTMQYKSQGMFYFNDIHCATVDHCIAVAEGHNVPQPGAHIFVTSDGGATWKNTWSMSGTGPSLMGVRDLDGKEGWAVGGNGFSALFLHTTDGGATWTNEPVAGLHCLGVDFASASNGYAICLNQVHQTQAAVFK